MDVGNILKRLRGVVGNAVVWAGCWAAVALAVSTVLGIAGGSYSWSASWHPAARIGVVGGLTSVAFSAVIGRVYRGRRLSEISWVRFGLGGGVVAGIVLPTIMFVGRTLSGDGPLPIEKWISSSLIAAVCGGIAAGVSLKLAQRAATGNPGDHFKDSGTSMPR
jgi:hypothetical protein